MSEFISVTAIIIIIIIWAVILISFISEKRRKNVQETSVMLRKLLELNSHYKFDESVQRQYQYTIRLQSKAKFDRYDLNMLFDDAVLHNDELMRAVEAVEKNRIMYVLYSSKIKKLKSEMTHEKAKSLHISYRKYVEIERELFYEQQIKPILECNVVCIAAYSSPQGRNNYSKKAIYKIDEVTQRYKILQSQIAVQNSEEMRRKRARSQMTDKLRYAILKRDGFRCKLCGRTADDGVKLHVDHITPVSKGGETVPSNLRTLCEACNLGKGDEIE